MVKSKKLLSLFLAVVMLLSVFTVMAFAYTVGPEDANSINIKYGVEKVSSAPMADGSDAYTGDDIYAVTVYAKATKGIDTFTAPVHFNKDHFSPILYVEGDVYVGTDTWAEDFGVENCVYTLGAYMQNVDMYDKNGAVTTKTMSAVAYGLGNAKATEVGVVTEYVSADHSLYNKWHAGLADNAGVMYVQLDASLNAKNCYLNVPTGFAPSADYVSMFTFYFQRNEGVTDADVVGDEFGVYTDDCYTVDGTTDNGNNGYYTKATYVAGNPNKNIVSNAVIEAPAKSIVNPMKGQIRFDKNENGGYAGTFDVRAIAIITGDDFTKTFGSIANAEANITSVGFVFAKGTGNYDEMKAAAQAGVAANAASGTDVNGYTYAPVDFISTSFKPGDYTFSCVIDDVNDKNATLAALAYIKYVDADGATQWAFYTDVQTVPFAGLYDTYYGEVFGA